MSSVSSDSSNEVLGSAVGGRGGIAQRLKLWRRLQKFVGAGERETEDTDELLLLFAVLEFMSQRRERRAADEEDSQARFSSESSG